MKLTKTFSQIDTIKIAIVALLVLNVLLGVYIIFFKPGVYALETMKAGGKENMKMAKQLYSSDVYIQQQKMTLEQILGNINQGDLPMIDDTQLLLEDSDVSIEQ